MSRGGQRREYESPVQVSSILPEYERCHHWAQVAGDVEGPPHRDKLGRDIQVGQSYTVISRVRELEDLFLCKPLNSSVSDHLRDYERFMVEKEQNMMEE
mmetsp:Transcript_3217/g.4946  ORF Transcript_3217/g.4946 Transcript_3217/m.4946 type:complete len:99 (+) Transcript_3217:1854-2150(+)